MSTVAPSRRTMALAQLAALLVSLGLSFEVSACPPGMDTGMEMLMGMETLMGGMDSGMDSGVDESRTEDGMACPFSGDMDEGGRASCPLAVGGIGTCGTNAPTPMSLTVTEPPTAIGAAPFLVAAASRADYAADIQLPPPRS